MIGQTVSQYAIPKRLCAGGMGEAYKAQNAKLNRPLKSVGFILQLVLCSAALQAQVHETTLIGDTSRIQGVVIADPGIALGKAVLLLPPLLPEGRFETFMFTDMHPGIPPPLLHGTFAPKLDLLSPYVLQQQRESRLSTLYLILGAAELGGAGYIAYRHIKKYGFP